MIFDAVAGVTIPYSTIPFSVNIISSQNGAITTADESGNGLGKLSGTDSPKLSRPLELI